MQLQPNTWIGIGSTSCWDCDKIAVITLMRKNFA